jgi:hypothetical protein
MDLKKNQQPPNFWPKYLLLAEGHIGGKWWILDPDPGNMLQESTCLGTKHT